jgi:succinoglycan biosynthesis protein ExoO
LADARFILMGDALYLFTQRIGSISADLSGQSRTVVNLRAMHDHTVSLFKRPRIRESRILLGLLRKRADAIDHQLSWSKAYPYLRARQPLALMREMMRDWRNWPMLVRHLIRRHQNNYLSS